LLNLWPDEDKAIALAALEQFDIAARVAPRDLSPAASSSASPSRAPRAGTGDDPRRRADRLARPYNTRVVWMRCAHQQAFGITVICNLHSLDAGAQLLR
jgi:phosphonate transport system ATP-binding protein